MDSAPLTSAFVQALREAWAGGAGAILPASFFAGAAMLVPIGVGAEPEILAGIGGGVLWVALALASLVTMERLYQADLEDGALDLWAQADVPLAGVALAKTLAHWFVSGLPLALISPLLGFALQVPAENVLPAAALYGLGGLAFFLWGGFGAALSATVRRGGLLIALIALPFYVPTALFGAMALQGEGADRMINLLFLSATTLFALAVAPFGAASALRLAVD